MIVRIVKLEFQQDRVDDFLEFFENVKYTVNTFPGCRGMQLLQNDKSKSVLFTYSIWEREEDLELYRASETFASIWPKIKTWFAAKPEAWTLQSYFDGLGILN